MSNKLIKIESENGLRERYGAFFRKGAPALLERDRVPKSLWPLIPYAQLWGVTDDLDREHLVRDAPLVARTDLVSIIRENDDFLDQWLAGPEAASTRPSNEYLAFSAMRMAADLM